MLVAAMLALAPILAKAVPICIKDGAAMLAAGAKDVMLADILAMPTAANGVELAMLTKLLAVFVAGLTIPVKPLIAVDIGLDI